MFVCFFLYIYNLFLHSYSVLKFSRIIILNCIYMFSLHQWHRSPLQLSTHYSSVFPLTLMMPRKLISILVDKKGRNKFCSLAFPVLSVWCHQEISGWRSKLINLSCEVMQEWRSITCVWFTWCRILFNSLICKQDRQEMDGKWEIVREGGGGCL